MASCTLLVCTADTGNTPNDSASFTPTASDLLVAVVVATSTVDSGSALTDSQGLGFTKAVTAVKASSTDVIQVWVANALAANSSMTVTWANSSDEANGSIIFVYGVSGMTRTGSSAIKQTAKTDNTGAATTPSVTFGSSVLTGNPTIVGLGNATSPAGLTPPTSWTEAASPAVTGGGTGAGGDVGYATPTTGGETASRNSGFTGTTVTWGSNSATAWGAVGIELDTTATDISITAPQATATAAGLVPTATLTALPPIGTATGAALVPVARLSAAPPIATATSSGLVPVVTLTALPPVSTATASGLVPVVTIVVPPPIGTATAAGIVPTVIVVADILIEPPVATATATALVPSVAFTIVVNVATATASGMVPAFGVIGGPVGGPTGVLVGHGANSASGSHGANTAPGSHGANAASGNHGANTAPGNHGANVSETAGG